MAALSNHKHELFAQALAKGECASTAYKSAGYSATGNSAEAAASRLLSDVKVQNRVVELQERAALKVEITVADIVEMLREDRDLARELEQSGSAVSATMGVAKVLGFLKERIEHSGEVTVNHEEIARQEVADIFGPTPHLIESANG